MRCSGNMRCDILTDFPFCKYAKLRSIQWVSRLSVRCWFVKAVYVTCAGVELKATGVTASAIEIEPGRKMSWRKRGRRAGLRRPFVFEVCAALYGNIVTGPNGLNVS